MTGEFPAGEWYEPGDLMICCPCGNRLGRWPAHLGPPTRSAYEQELFCWKPRCKKRVPPVFRRPPDDRIVRPIAA